MKLGKLELALIALAIAAVFFTAGYFSGRERAGGVNVTVTQRQETDTPATSGDGRIDLNTATRWEFMSLPGVGETLADRIVEYRTENGPFASTEELMDVRGIGRSLYDSICAYLKV